MRELTPFKIMADNGQQPDTGDWRECAILKPAPYISVEMLLEDGSIRVGYWSMAAWIVGGVQMSPLKWRPLP